MTPRLGGLLYIHEFTVPLENKIDASREKTPPIKQTLLIGPPCISCGIAFHSFSTNNLQTHKPYVYCPCTLLEAYISINYIKCLLLYQFECYKLRCSCTMNGNKIIFNARLEILLPSRRRSIAAVILPLLCVKFLLCLVRGPVKITIHVHVINGVKCQ